MAKKGSKALLVIGSFVVIGGVLAYFLFFRNRKRGSEGTGETPPSTGEPSAYTPTTSSTPSSSGSSSSSFTFPFKTTEEGNKFRLWVNNNYPDWAKKNKLDKSGSLNSYVEKAWKEFGATYTKYVLKPTSTTTTTTTPTTSSTGYFKAWSNKAGAKLYDLNCFPQCGWGGTTDAGKYEYVGDTNKSKYFDYNGNVYYQVTKGSGNSKVVRRILASDVQFNNPAV